MLRSEKERVVAELADRLRSTESLMVADYRGLTMPEIEPGRTGSGLWITPLPFAPKRKVCALTVVSPLRSKLSALVRTK